MEILVNKWFDRWRRKEAISDAAICKAVDEIETGLFDANLGGGLYKKRVAAPGKGKSGSYRTLLAFKSGARTCFVFGFAKSARANIDAKEEKALKALAKALLGYNATAIRKAIEANELREVRCDDEQKKD
ncbi:MAG: type II toxin-antitoxin system RelE/ParE family toxin [Rhodospirillaceae bacterium]|nr:type II toxin-antitoxin system RelE/ParE family toxin [Rhodospirillaceae bacterium]MBT7488398.1 type II toxin-antitoxin system RelE/ParE family toxin [Rhodospirillales bacterium]